MKSTLISHIFNTVKKLHISSNKNKILNQLPRPIRKIGNSGRGTQRADSILNKLMENPKLTKEKPYLKTKI